MPEPYPHPAAIEPQALLADCDVRRTRRSGPGGQHRNVTESAVVITHRPSGISAEANERRRQGENQRVALWRLRVKLALAIRQPIAPDRPTSELWRSRCRGGRISVNPRHADLPALLAEALDAWSGAGGDVAAAADRLGATVSQLVKLFKLEPAALEMVNRRRGQGGLHPLR